MLWKAQVTCGTLSNIKQTNYRNGLSDSSFIQDKLIFLYNTTTGFLVTLVKLMGIGFWLSLDLNHVLLSMSLRSQM